MSSSAQLHIPYHKNKKHTKVKSTFFTFDLCSYTMNEYCENENPASKPHPFYFNHPLSLSYPHLTPILMLAYEFQNAGFKCECWTLSRPASCSSELWCGTYLASRMEHEMEFVM